MQEMEPTAREIGIGQVARIIAGVTLLALAIGVWVCLWVPPAPLF
jgi:hypothetical protein